VRAKDEKVSHRNQLMTDVERKISVSDTCYQAILKSFFRKILKATVEYILKSFKLIFLQKMNFLDQ
jgi:hypothetical protein